MLGKGHGGLYKAPTKVEWRKRKAKRRDGSDPVYWSWILKMASCKIQESKEKARRSINCIFWGWMMIFKIHALWRGISLLRWPFRILSYFKITASNSWCSEKALLYLSYEHAYWLLTGVGNNWYDGKAFSHLASADWIAVFVIILHPGNR